jgi:hypothetical protein
VEFWTTDANTNVSAYVYDDFDGTTPSNKLAEVLDRSFDEAGYHSVALSSPVPVTSGDDVVAVVEFVNESYTYPIPLDQEGPYEAGRTYKSHSGTAGSWQAMGSPYDVAIRLRTSTGAAQSPTVTGITPSSGFNIGVVSITDLAGGNFQTGATVKLTRSGQSDINATNVVVVNASQITCDLDVTGAATGPWNVVVTNLDAESGTLSNGFLVKDPGAEEHFVYLPLIMRRYPPVPHTPVLDPISNPDGDGTYRVSWDPADLADTYTLQEDDHPAFSSPVPRYTGPGTFWDASSKAPGTYYYRVKASNFWGDSGWSDVRQVTVFSPPKRPTLRPINNADGDGSYDVTWHAVAQAQTYTLQEDTNDSFSSPATRYTGSGTSWHASGKSPGTYYYRVKASNATGDSPWSNVRQLTIQGEAGWVTILEEPFEGSFPGSTWEVRDNNSDSGLYYWAKRNCKDHGGSFSAWCVGGGNTTLSCGSNYRNDVFAWMIYGPFSLNHATAAELVFDWWSDTEYEYDVFFWGASTDGADFYGTVVTGDWSSWTTGQKLDLSDVPTLGNLLGEDQVWIAFMFGSDGSVTDKGSFVDDVLLRKHVGAAATLGKRPTPIRHNPNPNQSMRSMHLRLDQPDIWPLSEELH